MLQHDLDKMDIEQILRQVKNEDITIEEALKMFQNLPLNFRILHFLILRIIIFY